MNNHHALTHQARSLLLQTATLDVDLLETISLIVSQKVYAAEGYASLHAYCVGCLGMSDDSVWRRSNAADLLRRYPSLVRPMIEAREVHLTGLAMLHPIVTDENAEALITEAAPR